jgi:hypothetical protein
MIEGLQGTMITGGGIMMIDAGLILIMTVAGTGKTEDVTRRKTVMMKGRLGTGIADGPAEVEKSLAAEESGAGQKQESWKDVLPLVVDDAKFSLSLLPRNWCCLYADRVLLLVGPSKHREDRHRSRRQPLDRNISSYMDGILREDPSATTTRTWTGYDMRIHLYCNPSFWQLSTGI